ncbi:MAG TPA: oxidoreductase [Lentisphaeria bacterium]|jgi:predicted dehydrogenase|nr:oxidoreductase [Lentisphaeria bacterium]|tara:strand:+ start:752 stop:1699 length:948 start_codon:yes stop_codon:yes gene_type:complete
MGLVRVGVIGVGVLGQHHARLYRECPDSELVGIHDSNPVSAQTAAAEFETTAFATIDELVDAVDAVSIAVPTTLHHAIATDLLQRGCHVLVEKPLAATVEEGRELVALAQRNKLTLHVGHVERYNPVITYLEQCVDNPRFIESHRLAPYPPLRPGMLPRGTEVGVVLDLMIHDIDIILHLVNSDIERVDAVGIPVLSPTEDIANARLKFANGCVANITASRVSMECMRKIRVFQSNAYLSLDYQERTGEIMLLDGMSINREPVPIDDHNALEKELHAFVSCTRTALDTGEVLGTANSAENGLRALEIADQITRQM